MADTGFATGLLSGINQNIAQQKQNQTEGDKAQFAAFQEASKEYQQNKVKVNDQANKVEAMAQILSGGKPDAAAYSTARDAVEMGYTGPEHLAYVQDAYGRTKADMQANPDKWNVDPTKANQNQNYIDTNPTQTNAIHRFAPNIPLSNIEDVRQNNIQRPYNNLPGANWSNAQDFVNKQAAGKSVGEAKAKLDASLQEEGWGGSGSEGASSGVAPTAAPQAQAAGGQGNVDTSLPLPDGGTGTPTAPASTNIPGGSAGPNTSAGIQLPGSANPQTTNSGSASAPAFSVEASGQPKPTAMPYSRTAGQGLNEDALKSLPPTIQTNVKGIADGSISLDDLVKSRGDAGNILRQKYISAVLAYDPSWSTGGAQARVAARKEFTEPNGQTGQQITSINALANHLDDLDKSIDKLPNLHAFDSSAGVNQKGPPGLTHPENWMKEQTALASGGKDAQSYREFIQYKEAAVAEAQKVWSSVSGGSDRELQAREDQLSAANTPEELHASVGALAKLVQGKIDPLQSRKDQALGPHSSDILTPNARDVYDKLVARTSPLANQQAAPTANIPQGQSTRGGGTPDYSHLWGGGQQ